MLATPPCWAISKKALFRAYSKPPVELVVDDLEESNINLHLWYTFWLIIKKEDNVIVGTIDFKGEPNAKGEVEIGYGLGKQHEHHGYMTEAVQAFCKWGRDKKDIKYIIAETKIDNIASQRVLQRCGFVEYDRDSTIWWRLYGFK